MREVKHRRIALEDPDRIRPAELRDLFDHWLLHSRRGRAPRRSQFDMSVLRPVMPYAALVWVAREPAEIRYRAVGDRLVELLGEDPTGRSPEEVYHPHVAEEVIRVLTAAMRTGKPAYDLCEFSALGLTAGYRRLLLPLAHESLDAGYVIVCAYPQRKGARKAKDWRGILSASPLKPDCISDSRQIWDASMAANDPDIEIVYL